MERRFKIKFTSYLRLSLNFEFDYINLYIFFQNVVQKLGFNAYHQHHKIINDRAHMQLV